MEAATAEQSQSAMPRSAVPQKRHLTYELGIFKRATDEPGCRPHNAAPAFQPSLKCEEEPDSAPLSLFCWIQPFCLAASTACTISCFSFGGLTVT